MADVRINSVETDVNVVDASAALTPQMMERIVQEVLRRLDQRQRAQREAEADRSLGARRDRER